MRKEMCKVPLKTVTIKLVHNNFAPANFLLTNKMEGYSPSTVPFPTINDYYKLTHMRQFVIALKFVGV